MGRHTQKVVAREEAYKEARRRSGEERKEGGNMRRCWEPLSKETVWIIIVVGLGLVSAAFAFAAQATRVKVWCRIRFLFSFWGGGTGGRSLLLLSTLLFCGCILL